MVKLSELTEKKLKELKLNCGLTVQVKSDLTVEEQMALGLGQMAGYTEAESAERLPELACKLIADWDLTDSEGNPIEVNYDTFKILPISIKEMGSIMELCSTFQIEDKEKKDDGVS